jgi:uncharacterized cupin superfamily protein
MLLQGPLGAALMLGPERTDGRLSVVEHPLAPRALGSPVHTHRNEDEYSVVLEGVIGAEVGGEAFEAGPGGDAGQAPGGAACVLEPDR